MKKHLIAFLLTAAVLPLAAVVKPDFLYQDNFVFCAARPARITGAAEPGEKIVVRMLDKTYSAVANDDGRFLVQIPAPGVVKTPFDVTISGAKNEVVMKNVLSGIVLFAAGQSNMEVRVKETLNPEAEAASADHPAIREFNVEHDFDFTPRTQAKGKWTVVTPETAPEVGAAAFYCARILQKEMDGIPVGIINNAYSGSPQQAWIPSESVLRIAPHRMHSFIKYAHLGREGVRKRLTEIHKLQSNHDTGRKPETADWHTGSFNDSGWKDIKVPGYVETAYGENDGAYWFRRSFDVTAEQTAKDLMFTPGIIDDYDEVWINGQLIGRTGTEVKDSWNVKRNYKIPAGLLKNGKNVIAIRCFDSGHAGGLFYKDDGGIVIRDGKAIAIDLNGMWKIQAETILKPRKWQPDFLPLNKMYHAGGVLYNAMFHPLKETPVDAFLWYQGESNAGTDDYLPMLREQIRIVRRDLKNPRLPFLLVQLAAYQAPVKDANQSGTWPKTRADQAAVRVPTSVFMIPTIDIGDAKNIHPLNKQELGRRLALQLLQDVFKLPAYKGAVAYPEIRSATLKDGKIILALRNDKGMKTVDGKAPNAFAVSGSAVEVNKKMKEDFKFAAAEIKNNTIIVTVPEGITEPATLRYAWTMNPEVNTVNGNGFPLLPGQYTIRK